jgi:F0F1-type ATP synthase membrane subunit b/b'
MKPEEYEKAIEKLKEQLDLFIAEYGQELDESTTDVVETILNELMKGKDEGRMSADELVETAEEAYAVGSAKYRKKDAEEIRVAMREEVGAEFSDAAVVKLDGSLKNMRKASDEAKKSMAALGKQANKAMG